MQRHERLRVRIEGEPGAVSAVVAVPATWTGDGAALILGHGAGGDMETPLLVAVADALAEAGVLTMRFNFPYSELTKGAPDPQERLVSTYVAAVKALRANPRYTARRLYLGGKSMGGRIAAIVLADRHLEADGLVFLGYPLHPAGKKQELRRGPLERLRVPMLFVQGTRDPLCDLGLLEEVRAGLTAPSALEIIEGGDHSFALLRSSPLDPRQVLEQVVSTTTRFMDRPSPTPIAKAALEAHAARMAAAASQPAAKPAAGKPAVVKKRTAKPAPGKVKKTAAKKK